jgi:predicted nucleic acid-binding protein
VSDARPAPLILDTSVLIAVARADPDIIGLIQGYDARRQPLVIPALAIAGASLEVRGEEAGDLLAGLELLDNVTVAPLNGADQAARLADVIARTGLDPWDAHTAAIADVAICPLLTLQAAKWQQPSAGLDEPLHIIEISDPDGAEPGARG